MGGRFEPLLNQDTDDINQLYIKFVEITNKVTEETVGFQRNRKTAGLSPQVEQMCQQRRNLRKKMLINPLDISDTNERTGMLRKKCRSLRRVNSKKKPSIPLKRIIRETTVTTYFKPSGIWKTNPENHST